MNNFKITGIWYRKSDDSKYITFDSDLYSIPQITNGIYIWPATKSRIEQLLQSRTSSDFYAVYTELQNNRPFHELTSFLHDAVSEKDAFIKSMAGWEKFAVCGLTSFTSYCSKNDLVSEDLVDHFMNLLPPITQTSRCTQPGGAVNSKMDGNNCWHNTYHTFTRVNHETWRYCGDCFRGETCINSEAA